MRLALRPLLGLACVACLAWPAASAGAEAQAELQARFSPSTPGAHSALTVALELSGGPLGIPPPLAQLTLRLPPGLGLGLGSVPTCPPTRLLRKGAAGCPPRALIGRGRGTIEVHAGSQTIPEQTTVWIARAPGEHGRLALAILSQGYTPLDRRTLSSAVLEPDVPPYGSKLVVSVPPIPTVELEPDASLLTLSLTLGSPRAPALTVPSHCAGGFPFAAQLTFADASTADASALAPCS